MEEIKRLKARYCAYCDDDYDVDKHRQPLRRGRGVGRALSFGKVRRARWKSANFFVNAAKMLPFAVHMVMNPIIEVDGDSATGIWYLFQACTFADGRASSLGLSEVR